MIENNNSQIDRDHYEIYFAEKLWEMIPAFYRTEDGLAEQPDVLRSLIEIIAQQAAIVRRSNDRLWEDQFIELCNNWAVPYIADLLGTRLVSALNERGYISDVANTIAQRRRSGTLVLLEQLISRITDWEGTVVESFRHLGRTYHGLDGMQNNILGQFSNTPAGGVANLRSPHLSELVDGPFDEYHHSPDFRQVRGKDGRLGIHKLIFHLYRLKAYEVKKVTPFPPAGHAQYDGLSFSFDPSGRTIPLFMPRNRVEQTNNWHRAKEWELPAPIRCRLLGHAVYRIRETVIQHLELNHGLSAAAADELRRLQQPTFQTERRLNETLASLNHKAEFLSLAIYIPLLEKSLVTNCGKAALLPNAIAVNDDVVGGIVSISQISAGQLIAGTLSAPSGKRLIIDAENGLFRFVGDLAENVLVNYHYGFSASIGAGSYIRANHKIADIFDEITGSGSIPSGNIHNDGVIQINDSQTYGPIGNKISITNLSIQSKNGERPYLRLGSNWILSSGANMESFIYLEGLWLGVEVVNRAVILRGDYECVTINHCTFDPGGGLDLFGNPIHSVDLIIEAKIDQLIINSSIMGAIRIEGDGLVETLTICDSIIQSADSTINALTQNLGQTNLDRVTIFGKVEVHRLYANDTVITANVNVTDTQQGCFRYSLAPAGSRLPRSYPHVPITFTESNAWFTSRQFGHPGYGQITETAPEDLRRGAENGAELGVFNHLINPIKIDGLRAKVAEYMPFNLLPIFINET